MARYSTTLRDQNEAPIDGALVSVTNALTNLPATLTDDDDQPLDNPFVTGEYGLVVFNTAAGSYKISYNYGGRTVLTEVTPVGTLIANLTPDPAHAGMFFALDADGNATYSAGTGADSGLRTDLAASGGSALSGFLQSGTDATSESVQTSLRRIPIAPEQFGAVGDGATNDAAALTKAFTAAASTGRPVLLTGGKDFASGNLTIPTGVVLEFDPGATLSPVGSATLTVNGEIRSTPLQRVFGDGWTFAKTDIFNGHPDVPVEWFGARASYADKPDSLAAFNYAIAFCKAVRAWNILLGSGVYYTSGTIVIDGIVGVIGNGWNETTLHGKSSMTAGDYIFDLVAHDETDRVEVIKFSGFVIRSETPLNVKGLRASWFAEVEADNLHFYQCAVGLDLADTAYSWRLRYCRFYANTTNLILREQANNTLIEACQFLNGTTGISITGNVNSITICDETNFEGISGSPIEWSGTGSILKLTVSDSRFERCVGAIGRASGTISIKDFSFQRNFVENNAGTTTRYIDLADCTDAVISQNYFDNASSALALVAASATGVIIENNLLLNITKINGTAGTGGLSAADGYTNCRANNNGGVTGDTRLFSGLTGSKTYDPASIGAGASQTTTVTVTGAVLGDIAVASFSLALGGLAISAATTAADTVTVTLTNPTGGAIDLGSGTLRATVLKV